VADGAVGLGKSGAVGFTLSALLSGARNLPARRAAVALGAASRLSYLYHHASGGPRATLQAEGAPFQAVRGGQAAPL
jgi:hypothetical protein